MINKISAKDILGNLGGKSSSTITKLVADDLMGTSKKVLSLAEAIPDADYNWRPEDGVRSVSEVFVHIAASNYFMLSYLGMPLPKELQKDSENENLEKTITDKKAVLEFLKKSFDDAQKFLAGYTATDYDGVVKLPFGEFTKAKLLLLVATHLHEHLGQSIAYARANHITPPWSMPSKK
jgi:uncharacterized damage-inducible protein DinB